VTALGGFFLIGAFAEGILSVTSSVRRLCSVRDGLRLDVSASASRSVCTCVCLCVCAEGIPSHINSSRRLGSVRDGIMLDVSVSASGTVEFLWRVSMCICVEGIFSQTNSMLILHFGVLLSHRDTKGHVTHTWSPLVSTVPTMKILFTQTKAVHGSGNGSTQYR